MLKQMEVETLRKVLTKGTIVVLDAPIMDRSSPKAAGDRFLLKFIDDMGQLHGSWFSGGSLAISYEEDCFHVEPPYTMAYMKQVKSLLTNCQVDSDGLLMERIMNYPAGTPLTLIRKELESSEVYAGIVENGEDPERSEAFISALLQQTPKGGRLERSYYAFTAGTSSAEILDWIKARTSSGKADFNGPADLIPEK